MQEPYYNACMARNKYTREVLEEALKQCSSMTEVALYFGVQPASGSQAYITTVIRKFGLNVPFPTGRGWNRGGSSNRKKSPKEVLRKRSDRYYRERGYVLLRVLLESGRKPVCEVCGSGPLWEGKPIRFDVHHVNGDRTDNRAKNLQILCPNCHTQTPNYGSKKIRETLKPRHYKTIEEIVLEWLQDKQPQLDCHGTREAEG